MQGFVAGLAVFGLLSLSAGLLLGRSLRRAREGTTSMEELRPPADVAPSPRRVLERLVEELPDEVAAIEFLELRQATPHLYMVRLTQEYRGERTGFPLPVEE